MTRRPIWCRTYGIWHLLEPSTCWGEELPHRPHTHPPATSKIQYIICTQCSHVGHINNFHRTKKLSCAGDLTMTRVTHVSYTDDTFTFAVETCHLVHRYQHSRTACVFWLQRIKPIWAQDYSSVPQNETAVLSNTLTCGNTFQWTAIVMVTAARTKDLTKRFLAWWRTDSQFQSIWHLINLIQDWWWTHPANLTHHHNKWSIKSVNTFVLLLAVMDSYCFMQWPMVYTRHS